MHEFHVMTLNADRPFYPLFLLFEEKQNLNTLFHLYSGTYILFNLFFMGARLLKGKVIYFWEFQSHFCYFQMMYLLFRRLSSRGMRIIPEIWMQNDQTSNFLSLFSYLTHYFSQDSKRILKCFKNFPFQRISAPFWFHLLTWRFDKIPQH